MNSVERVATFLMITLPLLATSTAAKSAASPLERLRAKTRVDAVKEIAPAQLAGQYTSTSKELGKRVGLSYPGTIFTYSQMEHTSTASGPISNPSPCMTRGRGLSRMEKLP
jgi:hypothetical protein